MKNLLITLVAITSLSGAALAGPKHIQKHSKQSVKQVALICPVTGDKIASAKAAVGHTAYKGKTYYFCCAGCKPRFDKNPAKFSKDAAAGKFEKM